MVLMKTENKLIQISNKEDVKEAIYLPETTYLTKEQVEEFKNDFGIDLYNTEYISTKYEENEDELEEWLDDNKQYPTQICQGHYCEDIIAKEEIEDIFDNGGILINDDYIITDDSGYDYELYYPYWDGSNYRVIEVEDLYEIEAEHIGTTPGDTFNIRHYKISDGLEFSIYSSFYQGSLDEVEEDDVEKVLEYVTEEA